MSIDLFHAVYHVVYMIIDFRTYLSSVGTKSHRDWLQAGAVARLDLSATAAGILFHGKISEKETHLDNGFCLPYLLSR